MINSTSSSAVAELLTGRVDSASNRSEAQEGQSFMQFLQSNEELQAAIALQGIEANLAFAGKQISALQIGDKLPVDGKTLPFADQFAELPEDLQRLWEKIGKEIEAIGEDLTPARRAQLEDELESIAQHLVGLAGNPEISPALEQASEKLLAGVAGVAQRVVQGRTAAEDKQAKEAGDLLTELRLLADQNIKSRKIGDAASAEAAQKDSAQHILQQAQSAAEQDDSAVQLQSGAAEGAAATDLNSGAATEAKGTAANELNATSASSNAVAGREKQAQENLATTQKQDDTALALDKAKIDTRQQLEQEKIAKANQERSNLMAKQQAADNKNHQEEFATSIDELTKPISEATQLGRDAGIGQGARANSAGQLQLEQRKMRFEVARNKIAGVESKSVSTTKQTAIDNELTRTLQDFKAALSQLQLGATQVNGEAGTTTDIHTAFNKLENWSVTSNLGHLSAEQGITGAVKGVDGVPVLPVNVPVLKAEWAMAVGQRLNWMVSNRIGQAKLKLNPEELGPVEVKISIDRNQASVAFTAEHATTRQALEDALPKLKEMLESTGYELAESQVGDGSTGHQDAPQQADWSSASGQKGSARANSGGNTATQEEGVATDSIVRRSVHDGRIDQFV